MSVFSDADGFSYSSRGKHGDGRKADRDEGEPMTPLDSSEPLLRQRRQGSDYSRQGSAYSRQDSHCSNTQPTMKSLFFCLSVDNPFDPNSEFRNRVVPEDTWEGTPESMGNPRTFLTDDDFLLKYSRAHPRCPTQFQKVIEMLLRFKARGVEFEPEFMIERIPPDEKLSPEDPNQFHGWRLVQEEMLTSPDEDECYIKLHCKKKTLLSFAERQGHQLATNPYSFAGGNGMVYTNAVERQLSNSVLKYTECYPDEVPERYMGKKGIPWGYRCEVPHKMRLTTRIIREAWQFGGCGIAIEEMKKREVLVRQYFPLHNLKYLEAHGVGEWSSFKALLHANPLKQDDEALVLYFGERVAIYFVWLKKYTVSLIPPALLGILAGVSMALHFRTSLVNAVFAICLVIWAVAWGRYWAAEEAKFVADHQQEVAQAQEMVRDQFQPASTDPIEPRTIFKCLFEYPLTLRRKPNGQMVELRYSAFKRHMIRAFITYPAVVLLSIVMVVALIYVTKWRFDHVDDSIIVYASSALAVVISLAFGKIFHVAVEKLNEMENNRTDSEEETQFILKSFLFYFWSSYFALFAIALYPSDATKIQRLQQMNAQMLVICVVKPFFQNIQELLTPRLMNQFRRRRDKTGSVCYALCSMLCCRSMNTDPPKNARDAECKRLWRTTQREPYGSPAADFLEITIQFGYMAMFAAVFPWGPFAALIYNALEIRVDARKLLHYCQRPIAKATVGIGAWKTIFWILTGFSLITNSYLICVLSPAISKLGIVQTEENRYVHFVMLQYLFVAVITVVVLATMHDPSSIKKVRAKQKLLADVAIRTRLMEMIENLSKDKEVEKADLEVMASPTATSRAELL